MEVQAMVVPEVPPQGDRVNACRRPGWGPVGRRARPAAVRRPAQARPGRGRARRGPRLGSPAGAGAPSRVTTQTGMRPRNRRHPGPGRRSRSGTGTHPPSGARRRMGTRYPIRSSAIADGMCCRYRLDVDHLGEAAIGKLHHPRLGVSRSRPSIPAKNRAPLASP